jgi:hypothetical protein
MAKAVQAYELSFWNTLADGVGGDNREMPDVRQQIFAFSGVLKPKADDRDSFSLIDHALRLAGTSGAKRVTILPGKQAWQVAPDGNRGYAEQAVPPRLI